jgi:hypothetical protein
MSATVSYVDDTRNAEQIRNPVSVTPVQVVGTLNGTLLHGFVVLDAKGEFIAWGDNISTAKDRCDGDPLAHSVERCSDGETMCWKYGRGRVRP